MKFLHLADLHLGKSLGECPLGEDHRYILRSILELAVERQADAVLIAGDVYDRHVPSEEAVAMLDGFLTALADASIPVCMISGNHDSDQRLDFGSTLFRARGIHIAGAYRGEISCVDFEDEYGPVHVWMLPFVKASEVRHWYPEAEIDSYESAVTAALAHTELRTCERNVLMAHQFVVRGNGTVELSGSEHAATAGAVVGTVEQIRAACFDDFDYVALGHIHAPQSIDRETVRYAGTPLKYSLSEIGHRKSVPLVELGEKGDVCVELIPLRPLRDVRHLQGPLEEVLAPEHVTDTDDYIYVTLTDEIPIAHALGRIRDVYPNTVKLDYRNAMTNRAGGLHEVPRQEARTPDQLMAAFYRKVMGREPSAEEWELLYAAAREAEVIV